MQIPIEAVYESEKLDGKQIHKETKPLKWKNGKRLSVCGRLADVFTASAYWRDVTCKNCLKKGKRI